MITQKLYSPLYVHAIGREDLDNGCGEDNSVEMYPQEVPGYYAEIHEAILNERLPGEGGRGLMEYYHGYDAVNQKVHSLYVDVEKHGGRLWGVATIEVAEDLELDELDDLRDYISGQYSDGFGEGFEQRGIAIVEGELYVSLWSSEKSFRIMTEDEFQQHLSPAQTPGLDMGM